MKREVITGTDAEGNPDAVTVTEFARTAAGAMRSASADYGPDALLVFIPDADGQAEEWTTLEQNTPNLEAAVENLLANGWLPIGFLAFERSGGAVVVRSIVWPAPEDPLALKGAAILLEHVKDEYVQEHRLKEQKPC